MPDNLLVNRNGQTHQVDMANTASIQDTDLLLVNRDGTTYTVAGSEISRGAFSEVTMSPLSIIPEPSEQLITATADIPKVGDAVPADVFWKFYQYDNASGDAGKIELKSETNREISNSVVLPAAAAGKYIGCSVTYLAVEVSETERCAVGIPAGPVASMNGLRFEGVRETTLRRTMLLGDNSFTISFWAKIEPRSGGAWILQTKPVEGQSTSQLGVFLGGDNTLSVYQTTTQSRGSVVTYDKWMHIVVNCDGDTVRMYRDGVLDVEAPRIITLGDQVFSIGGPLEAAQYNGYYSDFYIVSDKACPPTTFGQDFAGGWGPLDSTDVAVNLSQIAGPPVVNQPYDSRANTDQEWSATTTGSPSAAEFAWAAAFDTNVYATPGASGSTTDPTTYKCSFTPITSIQSLEVATVTTQTLPGNFSVYDSSGTPRVVQASDVLSGSPQRFRLDPSVFTSVSGFGVNINIQVSAVWINGRLLVNPSVWNNSQNWSTLISGPASGWNTSENIRENGFDGNPDTLANANGGGGTMTFTPNLGSGPFAVEIKFGNDQLYTQTRIDGNLCDRTGSGSTVGFWDSVSFNELIMIADGLNANARCCFNYMKVDGAYLVDSGSQWNTSKRWSTEGTITGDLGNIFNAFDGDLATSATNFNNQNNNPATYTFDPPITGATSIKVYGRSDNGAVPLQVNGANVTAPASFGWCDVPGSTLTSFTIYHLSGTGASQLAAIEVDGEILKDPQDVWNTSQPWSKILELSEPGGTSNPAQTFNGELGLSDGTGASLVTSSGTPNPTATLPITLNNSKVRVYFKWNDTQSSFSRMTAGNQQTTSFTYMLNGANAHGYAELSGATGSEIIVEFTFTSGGGSTNYIKGYEVDGALLVDGGFGPDGCYLPFDSSLSNTDTAPYSATSNYTLTERMFDGDTTTFPVKTDGNDAAITFDPPLENVNQLRLFINEDQDSYGQRYAVVNGNSRPSGRIADWKDYTSELGGTTLTTLGCVATGNSVSNGVIAGIEINGTLYVAYKNIGLDQSGNGNNWTATNFNLEAKTPVTGVISSYAGTKKTTVQDPYINYIPYPYPTNGGSSGDYPTWYYIAATYPDNGSSTPCEVNFASPFSGYCFVTGSTSARYRFDGGAWTRVNKDSYALNKVSFNDVSKIEVESENSGQFAGLGPIYTNDDEQVMVSLPDKLQPTWFDTVLDTPMNDYAVFANVSSGAEAYNGNLLVKVTGQNWRGANSSIPVESGTTYFEYVQGWSINDGSSMVGFTETNGGADGNAQGPLYLSDTGNKATIDPQTSFAYGESWGINDIIGVLLEKDAGNIIFYKNGVTQGLAYSDLSADKYWAQVHQRYAAGSINFGQQPFMYAYREPNGTITIGQKKNTSQVWSDTTTPSETDFQLPYERGFDGVITGDASADNFAGWLAGAGDITITFPGGTAVQKTIDIWSGDGVSSTNNATIVVNGVSQTVTSNSGYINQKSFEATGNLESITLTQGGGGVRFYGIAIDGSVLIDTPSTAQNTAKIWSNYTSGNSTFDYVDLFNGEVGQGSAPASGATVTWDIGAENAVPGTVEINCAYIHSGTSGIEFKVNGTLVDISSWSAGNWYTIPGVTSIHSFSNKYGGSTWLEIGGIRVDGELLVDGTQTAQPLQLPWAQWVIATLSAGLAEADALKVMLLEHAQTYQAAEDYCEGSVIKAFGELWIAVNDAPATTFADLAAITSHSNWERLNISAN